MSKLIKFLDGKKVYIVAILTGICVTLQQLGITIPPYVYELLGLLGLGAIRSTLKKLEK